ncbi:MAG: 50S ribosomal protein L17 [Flammeovirgaceae bacterium]|nr:50S ribosomal protein L17 [Flammeovirgaceae bacterium]
MRHGKRFNHLSRKAPHRKSMLSNMASSLILHKKIETTVAKAKALRKYIEPILTRSKSDTTHSRRTVFSLLKNKESVTELFNNISEKIASRPGGYTRIIKTGFRLGDNAEMCIIELVDYNTLLLSIDDKDKSSKSTRRRRRKKSTANVSADETKSAPKASKKSDKKADKKDTKAKDNKKSK